ncbi:hypothetical protein CRE_29169 [Caenorhabditis remanei]|uniref:Uncharacterized protein n=1 Tax=Caenorhabditis remanei TaxID=31234 RepID=E3ND38_CAERE|nr:hypothetical protein CRE_29169 [Caenorhabditis remanei]
MVVGESVRSIINLIQVQCDSFRFTMKKSVAPMTNIPVTKKKTDKGGQKRSKSVPAPKPSKVVKQQKKNRKLDGQATVELLETLGLN